MLIKAIKEINIDKIDIELFQVYKFYYKVISIIKIAVQNNKDKRIIIRTIKIEQKLRFTKTTRYLSI